jgi:hypothetical protein
MGVAICVIAGNASIPILRIRAVAPHVERAVTNLRTADIDCRHHEETRGRLSAPDPPVNARTMAPMRSWAAIQPVGFNWWIDDVRPAITPS